MATHGLVERDVTKMRSLESTTSAQPRPYFMPAGSVPQATSSMKVKRPSPKRTGSAARAGPTAASPAAAPAAAARRKSRRGRGGGGKKNGGGKKKKQEVLGVGASPPGGGG